MRKYVILLALIAAGCTKSNPVTLVPVSGELTRDGEPIANVRLEFQELASGAFSFAETDDHGHFELYHTLGKSGAVPGRYRVGVFRPGKPIPIQPGRPVPAEEPMTPEEPMLMSDRSPIEVDIAGDRPNRLTIDLK